MFLKDHHLTRTTENSVLLNRANYLRQSHQQEKKKKAEACNALLYMLIPLFFLVKQSED